MAIQFKRFPTADQAEQALHNELRRYIMDGPGYTEDEDSRFLGSRRATAPYVIMVPGGSTPLRVYRVIREEPPAQVHPSLFFVLSDDRYVPVRSPESNFGHIMPMAKALRLPETRVLHPDPSIPLDESGARYDRDLQNLDSRRAVYALAILGIGTDGHTASLFPGRRREEGVLAAPVRDRTGFDRITTTEKFIEQFSRLIFFATGEAKRDILYEIERRPEDFPAGRIMVKHRSSEIWTDQGYEHE